MIEVGSLVIDTSTGEPAIVIQLNPVCPDGEGGQMKFDYQIFSDGQVFYIDLDEVWEVDV